MGTNQSEAFVELEFSVADDAYPAIRISEALDCRLDLLDALQADDGSTTAFFHAEGGDPDAVVEEGRASVFGEDANVITRSYDECAVEIVLSDSLYATFANAQTPMQSLVVRDGSAQALATVPPTRVPTDVVAAVSAQHPSAELVGKRRTGVTPPFVTRTALQQLVDERLTGRQQDALRYAFEHGYFDRPRRTSQQELAEKMGISASTFGQHLHSALRKLLATLFADGPRCQRSGGWAGE